MTTTPFSIVIPTYKEANNLTHLVQQIHATEFNGRAYEVIFVDDDSQDGSLEVIKNLQTLYPWVRMIVRNGPRSLSRSVMFGCRQAMYPLIVSMDADLSHPADKIPTMLELLESRQADMVFGSRYAEGGSVDANWSWLRRFISKSCAALAKRMLRLSVSDPLSGFFAIRKGTLMHARIDNPSGWKIALEILIKCQCKKVVEVPIHFSDRRYGKSKLTMKVGIEFLKQLSQLKYFQIVS